MKILVTGATGFVGRTLVPQLALAHEPIALIRRPPAIPLGASRTVVKDLTSPDLATVLPDDIEVVVHLAQAYLPFPSHAAEIFAVNALSTQRLADWARSSGVRRFVLASSGSVYQPATQPLREVDPAKPLSFHPATKLIAEQILAYYEDVMDVIRLRLFAPYGPGQTDRMIPRLINAVGQGRPVGLSRGGQPRINPIHVEDVVAIISQTVDGAGAPVVNLAGPRVVSVAEIAAIIGAAVGRAPVFEENDIDPPGDLIGDTARMHEVYRVPSLIDPADGIATMTRALVARA
jgi:nucleoside-diphosphate-sugar epimerase